MMHMATKPKPPVTIIIRVAKDERLRCTCRQVLGDKLTGRYETTCPRCKSVVVFESMP